MTRRYVSIQQRHKVELGRSNYLLRVINYFRDSIPAVRYASFLIIVAVSGVTTREKKKLDEPTHPILLVFFSSSSRFRRHRFRFSIATGDLPRLRGRGGTLGKFERTESTQSLEGWTLPGSPRSRESALAGTIYSLGSPFATLEPLILPVDREILKGSLTAGLRLTRVA